MPNPNWSDRELALLRNEDLSHADIAERIGRSYAAVKGRRVAMRREDAAKEIKEGAECAHT